MSSESDVSLLKNIVRNNQMSLEKLLQEKKQGLNIFNVRSWTSQYIFSICTIINKFSYMKYQRMYMCTLN